MEPMESLMKLRELLATVPTEPLVAECVEQLEHHEVIWYEGFTMDRGEIHDTYRTRYAIQCEVTRSPVVDGYEALLPRLEKWPGRDVALSEIVGSDASYLLFTSADGTELIGILRINGWNVERQLEFRDRTLRSGCEDHGVRLRCLKLLETW